MTPRATLVLGPSRAGKTRSLLNRYSTLLDVAGRGRCVWLAPNSTAVAEVRDALAVGSRLEPGVGTFAGFAQQLLVAGRVPARALAPGESRRLLEHAIAELRAAGQLRHFARVAETPGFVAQAGVFIADAKRRDAWAEALQKSARQQRERELAAIYGAYQRLLAKARAFDAEGLFWAARDAVKRAPELLAGIDLVVVDGFNDFTAAQYDILQRLAAAARETCISLTIDAATVDATAAARPDLFGRSAETLRTLGERMRCQRQWLDPHEEAATAPPMWRQVADKLFAAELTEGVAGDDQREPPAKYAPVSRPGGSAALRPQPPLCVCEAASRSVGRGARESTSGGDAFCSHPVSFVCKKTARDWATDRVSHWQASGWG
ncbi:MAG: AAA family ATPase [Planctomycetales bacterium]|nr:AAA family ATPase [Planctomycetales bacterium]